MGAVWRPGSDVCYVEVMFDYKIPIDDQRVAQAFDQLTERLQALIPQESAPLSPDAARVLEGADGAAFDGEVETLRALLVAPR